MCAEARERGGEGDMISLFWFLGSNCRFHLGSGWETEKSILKLNPLYQIRSVTAGLWVVGCGLRVASPALVLGDICRKRYIKSHLCLFNSPLFSFSKYHVSRGVHRGKEKESRILPIRSVYCPLPPFLPPGGGSMIYAEQKYQVSSLTVRPDNSSLLTKVYLWGAPGGLELVENIHLKEK